MKINLKSKFTWLFFLLATMSMAQEKKTFTLNDLIPGGDNYRNCIPKNDWYEWWGDKCVHLDADTLTFFNPGNSGKRNEILTLEQLNNWTEEAGIGKIHSLYNVSFPDGKNPLILIKTSEKQLLIDWKAEKVIWTQPLNKEANNMDWNPASRNMAYTVENNLFVTTDEGKEVQVTNEAEGIKCGQAVHRNEFGIMKGTFWSPKGNLLAFYRMDETMVTDYPQVDTEARTAKHCPDKYPMAGTNSHKVTVGIFNPITEQTVWLQAGDPTDRYFTNISWSPDEQKIYLIELPREQNRAELVRYNAVTGEREAVILTETHEKYVEPMTPITFLPWDNTKFIYQSQSDGFNHLYLYNIKGEKLKQITQGNWLVQNLLGFNSNKKEVIIQSTEISPLQSNVYAVSLTNDNRRLVGEGKGVHNAKLSESGKWIIDNYSTPTTPRVICVASTVTGKVKENLLEAANPWAEFNTPEISVATIKAADDTTELYYRLVKPVNFNPNKQYPAVIYVYGGPHLQNINASWNYAVRGWDIYMAQQGYVVLTLDNRGSCNRGLEFENCTFRRLGEEEMKDQLKGVELLKSLPYVDGNRLGVHGWSYGGFMTTNLMLTYPDIFKVGVAGGPVTDWKYYEVMYGERYMDTPDSNPEGYKNCSLLEKAGNLKGRLLVIHGGNDPVCVPQMTYSFLKACVDKGTHPDLFIYPGHGHNMLGRDRVHLHEHITRYFEDFLK